MKRLILLILIFVPIAEVHSFGFSFRASGAIKDPHGKPIDSVKVSILVNGKVQKSVLTSPKGDYIVTISLPPSIRINNIEMEFSKNTYKTIKTTLNEHSLYYDPENNTYDYYENITLIRTITPAFWIATVILVSIFVLISLDIFHRTLAATLGASLLLFISYTIGKFYPGYFVISFKEAMRAIDFNVIFLLMGMMIIVGVMKKTGIFQWLAYKSYQISRGNVMILSTVLMFVTAVVSMFLDNVTTMLLLVPVTIEISLILNIDPFSLLLPEVIASNIGGTATLIGDPPNIMIGSYANLTFNQFIINLTPVIFIIMIAQITIVKLFYGKEYKKGKVNNIQETINKLRMEYRITDAKLLRYSLFILSFVIMLFVLHGFFEMEPSVAALIGASLLLVISGSDVVEIIEKEIEWPTLVFFMMLFIIVGAAEETGMISMIATAVKDFSGNSLTLAVILIIWISAIASAFVDNIPFTATMLPVVGYMTQVIPHSGNKLWWALALGACLGGNGTLIGASANVVTAGLSEKAGFPISFNDFLKFGGVSMIVSVTISMIWLLVGG